MESTSIDTSSGISSNLEVLGNQTVNETKVSDNCDCLLDQGSSSSSSFSLCDSQDNENTLKLNSAETINSGGEFEAKDTAGDTTAISSVTASPDVAVYRHFCAIASSAIKLSEDSVKRLQTIVLNVNDPEILTFWKNYQKSIARLLEHFSASVTSGFLSNLAISESDAAIYLDELEAGLAEKEIDPVKESTKPVHDEVGEIKGIIQSVTSDPLHTPTTRIFNFAESTPETVKEAAQVDSQVVKKVKANGKYKSEWGELEVRDNKVVSLKFNSVDLLLGDMLLGMPISVASHLLNRDLKVLDKYGEKHPNWCKDIKIGELSGWDHVRQILADCSIKQYQWTLHDAFTEIGTKESEDPKLDGILALRGTVEATFECVKEFGIEASKYLEDVTKLIVNLVYLKCPRAKLALKYVYAVIHRSLLESWHRASTANKKQRKITVKCQLNHFSEDLCFEKNIGFLPIQFSHFFCLYDLLSEFEVQCDADITMTGGSEEATRRYLNDKWAQIPHPKPAYVETVETLRDEIDQGVINSDTLFLALTS